MEKPLVHIIESPGASDFLDDRQEGQVLRRMLELIGINATVYTVVNAHMFAQAIQRIVALHATPSGGQFVPMLHISGHGNEQGIGFTDSKDGFLGWDQLADAIQPLNAAYRDSLVVTMSTCFGYSAASMARYDKPIPYGLVVGPTTSVLWSDATVAFCSFYLQFLRLLKQPKGIGFEAFMQIIQNMNAAAGLAPATFWLQTGRTAQSESSKAIVEVLRTLKPVAP